jgi:simple sugar transport system permease protein
MLWDSLFQSSIRLTIPVLLAALGELMAQRSGVINIGLEGMMSAGAYIGYIVMSTTGDPWLASGFAATAGMAVAAIMVGAAIWGQVNQILVGFALFIMVPGITAFLFRQHETSLSVTAPLEPFIVPGLSDIPFIGRALFSQDAYYYATVALCILLWLLLNRTRFGLSTMASGHDPEVAVRKGVRVNIVRSLATLLCGGVTGLAGAALTVGALGGFTPGVTGGRGFLAIAVVILGRWKVGGVVIAALAIGFTDALRLRLSSLTHFPIQLIAMLPWIVMLTMLIVGARLGGMPRALGRNFGAATSTE